MRETSFIRIGWLAGILIAVGSLAPAVAGAQEGCPNEQLRDETHSTQLPECRAYELVTPPYMEGEAAPLSAISEDGSHLIIAPIGVFAGAEHENSGELGGAAGRAYEVARGPAGWISTPLSPPSAQFSASLYDTYASPDLTRTLWRLRTPSQPDGEADLYRRESNGSFLHIGPMQPPSEPARFGEEGFDVGVSQDLEHVFFKKKANGGLWPGDMTVENSSLYEYSGVEQSEPKLVGIKNDGPLSSNSEAQLVSECGIVLGSEPNAYNAISPDGGTVFFTAMACGSPPVNEVYARIDQSHTVAISEPVLPAGQCSGTCAAAEHREAIFQGASEDGSKVFFTTEQPLLNSDKDTTNDLYEAELEGAAVKRLVMVSEGETKGSASENDPTPGEGADVQGVAQVSEDGSHVYFVATGVLTNAANGEGDKAEAGADNLYAFDTASGRTAFVASLSEQDGEIWQQLDVNRPVANTPDGDFLVLVSHADLTHEGTSGEQIYEYDARSGSLKRISLGQHSALAPKIVSPSYVQADRPTEADSYLTMSDDGSDVFFESADGLTPQAPNDQLIRCFIEYQGACLSLDYVKNVYEYHEGSVYLIASVQPPEVGPVLLGTDLSGDDVFFTSPEPLVAQDTDTQQDIYDARVDGGFPAPVKPPGCSGEACLGPLGAAPLLPSTAGSATQGPGENSHPAITKVAAKPLTRKQKLARALKACKKKPKRLRAACDAQAKKSYGSTSKAKHDNKGSKQ
jgi:hypothetical protein